MADRSAFSNWLGIAESRTPRHPEELDDPKRTLVELAASSRNRALRSGLVRVSRDSLHTQGPDYNTLLGEFVTDLWNPEIARSAAPSLERAIRRISQMGSDTPV